MIKVYPVLVFLFLLASNSQVAAAVRVSSVVYPPLVLEEALPQLGFGMCRDIVTEAFKAVSVKVDYDLVPMSRTVWSIAERENDACFGSMRWFSEKGKDGLMDYVDVVNLNFVGFYKRDRFPFGVKFDRLEDLRGYLLGNVRGSSSQRAFDEAGLNTDLTRNIELNFLKLNAGRFDFAVSFMVTGQFLIKTLYPRSVDKFSYLEKPLLRTTLSLIFRKEKKVLKREFLNGLKNIVRNGVYYEILERYYGKGKVPPGTTPDFLREGLSSMRK